MTVSKQFEKITSYQGPNFTEWFGDMPFKKSSTKLVSKRLSRDMNDKDILAELKPSEVSLGEIYSTLENGDKSIWYLFYAKDNSGVLRAVRVGWGVYGWHVRASSVGNPVGWDVGYRVFSRNFGTETLSSEKTLSTSDALTPIGKVYRNTDGTLLIKLD